jgi:predicted PolB exonuclease-like 3'-5' exonuclease
MPFDAKPWDRNPFDTMVQWDSKNNAKLDKIARALGLEGKGDVDGSDVYQMWKDGKFTEIADYCKSDVAMTREVYKKMIAVLE